MELRDQLMHCRLYKKGSLSDWKHEVIFRDDMINIDLSSCVKIAVSLFSIVFLSDDFSTGSIY